MTDTSTAVATVAPPKPPLVAGGRPLAIIPSDIAQVWRFAELMAASGLAPRDLGTPEKISVAIMHGLEVGLSPMQAVQKIAVINGRPTIWGDAVLGIVRASRLLEWIKEEITGEGDAMVATCTVKRHGDPEPVSRTFSAEDAKAAGLWGKAGPWQTYRKRMLQMRARAFSLRDVFPDVTGGLYIREELEGTEDDRPASVEPPAVSADPPTPIEEAIEQTLAPATAGPAEPPATEATGAAEPAEPPSTELPPATAEVYADEVEEDDSGVPAAFRRSADNKVPERKPGRNASRKSAPKPPEEPAPEFNEANWAEDCGKAAQKATNLDELAEAQQRLYLPHASIASEKIRAIALGAFTFRANELSQPEEPAEEAINPDEFLRNLEGALGGVTAPEMLGDVKEKYLLPVKGQVPQATWDKAVKLYRDKVASFTDDAELAA